MLSSRAGIIPPIQKYTFPFLLYKIYPFPNKLYLFSFSFSLFRPGDNKQYIWIYIFHLMTINKLCLQHFLKFYLILLLLLFVEFKMLTGRSITKEASGEDKAILYTVYIRCLLHTYRKWNLGMLGLSSLIFKSFHFIT